MGEVEKLIDMINDSGMTEEKKAEFATQLGRVVTVLQESGQ